MLINRSPPTQQLGLQSPPLRQFFRFFRIIYSVEICPLKELLSVPMRRHLSKPAVNKFTVYYLYRTIY
jgi:hypothetical protein